MVKTRCSVFDEGLDAQCTTPATMVRIATRDGSFPTCAYYCQEHGEDHGAVVIDVALRIRRLRDRALRRKDEHQVHACDQALLGDELAIDECVDAIAQEDTNGTTDAGARR
jgi:hypothetical protein